MAERDIHPSERWRWTEGLSWPLQSCISHIDTELDRYDDPQTRLYALELMESYYRSRPRLQALALWRLHRQL